MKFTLEIELGNDAMRTYNNVREAISDALQPARRNNNTLSGTGKPSAGDGGKLSDVNGNTVGKWEVSE